MDAYSPGASAPLQAAKPAVFLFHSTEVRTVDRDGQVWFVAGDIAKALGYRDALNMTRVLDEDEADTHIMRTRSEDGTLQTREVTIISESGLYHALLKSRKPQAKPLVALRPFGRRDAPRDIPHGDLWTDRRDGRRQRDPVRS